MLPIRRLAGCEQVESTETRDGRCTDIIEDGTRFAKRGEIATLCGERNVSSPDSRVHELRIFTVICILEKSDMNVGCILSTHEISRMWVPKMVCDP